MGIPNLVGNDTVNVFLRSLVPKLRTFEH